MFLMTEFERPERVQSVWESMTAQLMDYGLDWREAPGLRVFDHVLRGDYEAAIPSMLEMLSEPLAQDPKRPGLVLHTPMAPVADLPEVAARLAENEREWTAMREAVLAMLADPDWK